MGCGDAPFIHGCDAMRVVAKTAFYALVIAVWLPVSALAGNGIAMGLAPVNDWSTQQPFLDVMKTARRWIGHRPNQWGGMDFAALEAAGVLDENGWPTVIPDDLGSIGTVLLTDLPTEASLFSGRYRLRFDGEGIVEVGGRATNVRYGRREVLFDFTPGPGPVEIRIQRTDRQDYVRNITIVKLDHVATFDAGAVFHPTWLAYLDGLRAVRFMDWMNTNNSDQRVWKDRAKVGDFSYSWRGVPVEVMVMLANKAGADPWFNMPHLANDTYSKNFAKLVNETLSADQNVYVEYSNEVWNWQFDQAEWADAKAKVRWSEKHRGAQYYGMRAAQVADIWSSVFVNDRTRLINVVATQTGWLGLETDILNAPNWVGENPENNRPPHEAFDAYAVTGYFGHYLGTAEYAPVVLEWLDESRDVARSAGQEAGLSGVELKEHTDLHQFDLAFKYAFTELGQSETGDTVADLSRRIFPYHKKVADQYGLKLIMYEGGSHVVGIGNQMNDPDLAEFFVALNYTNEMGALYDDVLTGWADAGGGLFNAYSDVQAPGKWGSWGALRFLGDDNPRWTALGRRK